MSTEFENPPSLTMEGFEDPKESIGEVVVMLKVYFSFNILYGNVSNIS